MVWKQHVSPEPQKPYTRYIDNGQGKEIAAAFREFAKNA
jgi:hypothetical protein